MSDKRDVDEYASWYTSYMDNEQGKALVKCLHKEILRQRRLLEDILGEIELCDEPREEHPETVLESIRSRILQPDGSSHKEGYYEWEINNDTK